MKTILVPIKNVKLIHRYFFRSGLVSLLIAGGTRVVLLVRDTERSAYENEFGKAGVAVAGMPLPWLPLTYRILTRVAAHVFRNPRFISFHFLKYEQGVLPFFQLCLRIILTLVFSFSRRAARLAQDFSHRTVLRILRVRRVTEIFDEYKPDAVFLPSLHDADWDITVLAEARRRKIPTAGSVRVWSSLGPGPFLLSHPDILLVGSKFMKEMATRDHFFREDQVRVTGFPYFDWFLKKELVLAREDFLRSLGIGSDRRLVLYASSGVFPYEREIRFAEIFEELVKNRLLPENTVMLFRTHPYYSGAKDEVREFQSRNFSHVVMAPVVPQNPKHIESPEEDKEDLTRLLNSIYHSSVLLTPGSTVFVEAAIFEKPMIALAFDADTKVSYWNSFARRYDGSSFEYGELVRSGGIRVVKSVADLTDALNCYLSDSSLNAEGRKRLRERFAGPLDGRATERLAQELVSFATRS